MQPGLQPDGARDASAETLPPELPAEFLALPERYSAPEDSLKRRAALYLLGSLPEQWHYDAEYFDSTGFRKKVMDYEVITPEYLAENIEYAFKAWELPRPVPYQTPSAA